MGVVERTKQHTLSQSEIDQLQQHVLQLIKHGRERVDEIEVAAQLESGFSVEARMGDVEKVVHHQAVNIQITVYHNQCVGSVSISDMSKDTFQTAFEKACTIAAMTQVDNCAGLADAGQIAFSYPDCALYHPWEISVPEAINMAIECETMARCQDERIIHSESADVTTINGFVLYANSLGFCGSYSKSRHSLSCSLVAQHDQQMQSNYDYSVARKSDCLAPIEEVAKMAAKKTVAGLGARKLTTRQCPVIFDAGIARGLLGSFVSAISGSTLYRKTSFLYNHLGKKILPKHINIWQDPHLRCQLGSRPFDSEGVTTRRQDYIANGVLENYVLSSYSARQLDMATTGNAGGICNVFISCSDCSLQQLFKEMGRGLYVTSVMGQGVNLMNGNYSRGAMGFWIENGEIQYPVEEITIAGNLKDMFHGIVAIGNDMDSRSVIKTGSIWIDEMTIAGD